MHKQTEHLRQSSLDSYFSGVTIDLLDYILPHCEVMLQEAIKGTNGRQSYQDLLNNLYKGEQQLWIVGKEKEILACIVTEIVLYPKMKVCKINICTGHSRQQWQSYISKIEEWAYFQGCERIEALARKGWIKILKDWDFSHIFIEKSLVDYAKQQTKTTNSDTNYRTMGGTETIPC